MKGDFSRIRYNPKKNYTRVLKQQGRVDLDSDWNEQSAILDGLDRKKMIDVIGHCGVPKKGGGFKISPSGFLNDVVFPSSTSGWAVGNDANIIFTSNAGATWQKMEPPAGVAVNLKKVVFPSADTGWIVGDDATILKIETDLENSGSIISKQSVQLKMPVRLLSISFVNGNTDNGWVAGDHATLLATKDGGNTWTSQSAPAGIAVGLKDIFFISATVGWAIGQKATILHTADGGTTWEKQTAPATISGTLRSIHFNTENDGWVVGDEGVILHTTNGGLIWNLQPASGVTKHFKDIFFITKNEGWIVGNDGIILHTTNEGFDWNAEASGLSATLLAVYFESTGLGCVVGKNGAILTRQADATVWISQSLPGDFRISFLASDGRIYVEGLCCDLDKKTSYFNQPDYPNPPLIDKVDNQTDLVYLDVWERHITAIEDPDIQEVALGGPDTTTRVKTVCQIKIEPNVDKKKCKENIDGWPPEPGKGRLTTRAEADATSDQPCIIAPGGGYRGLDNRLYRVEIHTPGDIGTATFKWSRDNGSVVYAIENFEAGDPKQVKVKQLGKDEFLSLKKGDWVEILGDETELKGEPGTIAQILDIKEAQRIVILSADVSIHSNEMHPRIRRWDQKTDTVLVNSGKIPLEKGVEIEFSGEAFHTGDYWVFAARTATANVEELTDEPPMGISHYYCKLALVTWHQQSNGKWQVEVTDCRKDFPSLTEICAEDICFDNSNCELAEAETVQDAIDRLCKANNLRFHNKHLHGWGIVCGLQVYCGTEIENGRMTVKVKEGYALDCDGNDLVVQQDKILQIMEMIKAKGLLKDKEDGEVCLTMNLNDSNQLEFNVEPYDPNDKSNSWKGGELVENIYNNCLKPVVEFFQKEVTGNGEETALVGIHQKRITSLLNLLIQFLTPEFGQNVYISPQEDKILRDLYESLKALLRSKTYCAMFDNVEQFPDYPGVLAEMNIPTIFSKGFTHTRIRVDQQSKRAYTVGGAESPSGSNLIYVFDLNSQQMVAELEIPGGKGIKVQDVAFSANGSELYAIGLLNDEDSIFAVADIKDKEQLTFVWRPIKTFCSTIMVTLATLLNDKSSVYAIARGKGLYMIDPSSIDTVQNPAVVFNASGQLVIDSNTHIAYATLGNNLNDPLQYNQIQGMNLDNLTQEFQTFFMSDKAGNGYVGEDDIELARGGNGTKLCVVSNASPGASGNKNLLIYNITPNSFKQFPDNVVDLGANTDIKLAFNTDTEFLMVIFEDSYRVRLVSLFNTDIPKLLDSYHHPVQIYPESIAMGSSPDNPQVYVYNWVSNTFNIIPADRFQPKAIFPLDKLTEYRKDVLEAYVGLFSKLIQYLKDCICDQLLLKCPTCDEEDKLYLACVSIRENQVYKVCNFSKRKYVKSFPAFDYWLSWIPIGPMVRKVIETACCAVLPDLFGNVKIGGDETRKGVNMKGTQVKYGIASLKNFNFDTMFKERKTQSSVLQGLAGDWLGNLTKKQVAAPERTVKQAAMVGKPVDEVKTKLENANIEVTRTELFDPLNGPKNLMKFTMAPTKLKENSRVVLYEENGKVKYYALEDKGPANVEELRTQINTQKAKIEEVTALQTEVSNLKMQLEAVQGAHQNEMSLRDKQIDELQKSVTRHSNISTEFESLKNQVTLLSKIRKIQPKKGDGQ